MTIWGRRAAVQEIRILADTGEDQFWSGIMSVSSIASLSTAMATAQTDTQIGVSVLKKSIDVASNSALELLQAIPSSPAPSANLPSNLGQNINTTA